MSFISKYAIEDNIAFVYISPILHIIAYHSYLDPYQIKITLFDRQQKNNKTNMSSMFMTRLLRNNKYINLNDVLSEVLQLTIENTLQHKRQKLKEICI